MPGFLASQLAWQASLAKYEMDDSLGLFGGWREALDEQLADIAEDHEAEKDRLSSTFPLFPPLPASP